MRVLFAGTPDTAVPVLQALLGSRHEVVGVLTRPDAPVGRKRVLTPSPVARAAEAAGVPVVRAARLRGPEGAEPLDAVRRLAPDVAVVVAYGALVPAEALRIPLHGWLNLHFSHLPAYRGAAPVQRAVMDGVAETGADVFQLEEGLDTGPVFARLTRPVAPEDTAGDLLAALAEDGGPLVLEVLEALAAGTAHARPQSGTPTHAPKLTAADGLIDPARPVREAAARINGVTPEPGAWGRLVPEDDAGADPVRLKVGGVRPVAVMDPDWPAELGPEAPGAIRLVGRRAWLRTDGGALLLDRVQPAGKKEMAAADWARGLPGPVALLAGPALDAEQPTPTDPAHPTTGETR
ncbi:methionyl-tRNA formyltransferase [Micrococcus sp.]|uniref:methionyl-tRNA formyltransferase n=1 Tax=Micrococcus sp. TaxID=1271 RepID=UPI002A90AAEF|nr:methionyl-tRNA formyltransferase [Micrococcus sp.]MDY6054777.1 methionyl-tRNA formyltransferase [Micrococcus sp.]